MPSRFRTILADVQVAHQRWIVRNQMQIRQSEPWVGLIWFVVPLYILLALSFLLLAIVIKLGTIIGTGPNAVLFLGPFHILSLIGGMAAMFAASAGIGGYMRTITERLDRLWSISVVTIATSSFFALVNGLHRWIIADIDVSKGSQIWIVAFLTALLIVIGYVCKVPWDRARDLSFKHHDDVWRAADRRRWKPEPKKQYWRPRNRRMKAASKR